MQKFIELTKTNGGPVYVRSDAVTGVFENPSLHETVVNMVSGGYYQVTESAEFVVKLIEKSLLHE